MKNNQNSRYDVIVIGSGPGGLSAAAALARSGRSVIVFEKGSNYGGNCSAFNVGGYTFDLAVHQIIGGDGSAGQCSRVLDSYGIKDNIRFKKLDNFVRVIRPNDEFDFPVSLEAFKEILEKRFPERKKETRRLIDDIAVFRNSMGIISSLISNPRFMLRRISCSYSLRKKIAIIFRGLWLFLGMRKTAAQLLGDYYQDKDIRSLVAISWPYVGLAPHRLSGLLFLGLISSITLEGSYYPMDTSQAIADEMVKLIGSCKGKVVCNSPVKKIVVNKRKATGVVLESGERINAEVVISNADALQTFSQMLDRDDLPKPYYKKIMNGKVSVGPFKVFLGLDYPVRDNGLDTHEYFFFKSFDHDECFKQCEAGYPGALSAYSPSYINPALAPSGHSTLILTTFFPWKTERDWRINKEQIADEMILLAQTKIHELSKHIVVKKIFTPEDLFDFSGAQKGAMYGWENSVSQSLISRLGQTTPINNLYLAGHWTVPGCGVSSAIISGWMVARKIIARRGIKQ